MVCKTLTHFEVIFCRFRIVMKYFFINTIIGIISLFEGVIGENLINVEEHETYTDYVNPLIGTSNFGATNPGAISPRGMVSLSPFNVSGKKKHF